MVRSAPGAGLTLGSAAVKPRGREFAAHGRHWEKKKRKKKKKKDFYKYKKRPHTKKKKKKKKKKKDRKPSVVFFYNPNEGVRKWKVCGTKKTARERKRKNSERNNGEN
jgi:hypothetical protein